VHVPQHYKHHMKYINSKNCCMCATLTLGICAWIWQHQCHLFILHHCEPLAYSHHRRRLPAGEYNYAQYALNNTVLKDKSRITSKACGCCHTSSLQLHVAFNSAAKSTHQTFISRNILVSQPKDFSTVHRDVQSAVSKSVLPKRVPSQKNGWLTD